MKVARKHIITALEAEKLLFFGNYAIKAHRYTGKDKRIGEFGWTIAVLPTPEARLRELRKKK